MVLTVRIFAKVPPEVGAVTFPPGCPTFGFTRCFWYLRLLVIYVFQTASALLKLQSGSFLLELSSSDLGA